MVFMQTITFEREFQDKVLDLFGKKVKDNIIVEKETEDPVLTPKGKNITEAEFAGIKNGSEIIIANDLSSLITYAKKG
jgi:predicted HAD superfamily hydrolase